MEKRLLHDYVTISSSASIAAPLCLNRLWVMQDQPPMTSETVYSVELVSRMTYLCANSLRGTYTGTLRRNVPSIPVTTRECPFSVRLADKSFSHDARHSIGPGVRS